jgi:prevent-host-death family protein
MAISAKGGTMRDEGFSIAEAKDALAKLVHRAEERSPVVITRRGKPVAVIVSYDEYERHLDKMSFSDALDRFYETHETDLFEDEDPFRDVRDRSKGRDVIPARRSRNQKGQ